MHYAGEDYADEDEDYWTSDIYEFDEKKEAEPATASAAATRFSRIGTRISAEPAEVGKRGIAEITQITPDLVASTVFLGNLLARWVSLPENVQYTELIGVREASYLSASFVVGSMPALQRPIRRLNDAVKRLIHSLPSDSKFGSILAPVVSTVGTTRLGIEILAEAATGPTFVLLNFLSLPFLYTTLYNQSVSMKTVYSWYDSNNTPTWLKTTDNWFQDNETIALGAATMKMVTIQATVAKTGLFVASRLPTKLRRKSLQIALHTLWMVLYSGAVNQIMWNWLLLWKISKESQNQAPFGFWHTMKRQDFRAISWFLSTLLENVRKGHSENNLLQQIWSFLAAMLDPGFREHQYPPTGYSSQTTIGDADWATLTAMRPHRAYRNRDYGFNMLIFLIAAMFCLHLYAFIRPSIPRTEDKRQRNQKALRGEVLGGGEEDAVMAYFVELGQRLDML